jgi:GntR family histidine utilization transcriptional repressor
MSQRHKTLSALPRDTARPLYQQIKDAILDKVRSGVWLPGERLPSENKLVSELGVSRMTITRALRELTEQGHLQRVHGVGTFVARPQRHASLIELRNIADEIRERGMLYRAEVLRLEQTECDAALADSMESAPGAAVFHIELVHYQDRQPIQLEDRYVNPEMAPGFLAADFERVTPTQYLIDRIRPEEMEHIVQATLPDPVSCRHLGIPDNEPCLRLLRRTWSRGRVVTAVSLLYPSSRYDLGARYATDLFRKKS